MTNEAGDEQLIADARGGKMSAFKMLVERYEGKVAGIVKSMLSDTPEAVDVGQEVFIRFYESLDKFKGESSLGTYLVRIAINLSLNEIKKKKRKSNFFQPLETGYQVRSEESKDDIKEIVQYEIAKLDPDFRLVVMLRMIEGYSTEETAKILDIPIGTVLSRLSRAQKKLKDVLSQHLKI
jgi:RNA polymerase sigma-70 factor (ECF subfamily)